jgi:hypothetical protein
MALPKVHEDLTSIVIVGNFNPAIFHPAWFAAKGLIRESEASNAVVELIHPDLAQYRAGWLHVSVTRDRFAAATSDPASRAPLRDLVLGTFELLEHTPTASLGLNRSMHIDLVDDQRWHALGHLVAPKEPWAGILEKPGMRSLLMEAQRTDGVPGRTFCRLEPSQKYPHAAFIDVSSEYAPDSSAAAGQNTSYFISRIRDDWDRIMGEALAGIATLVQRVPIGGA